VRPRPPLREYLRTFPPLSLSDFLRRHRIQGGVVMLVVGWLLLIGIVFALFQGWTGRQHNPNRSPVVSAPGEVVLLRNRAGHYVANGEINGLQVTFLLDTGATQIALPLTLAQKLDLKPGGAVQLQTAAGPVTGYTVRLASVRLAAIEMKDVSAVVMDGLSAETVLLGMNFLRHLDMVQSGERLILRVRQ